MIRAHFVKTFLGFMEADTEKGFGLSLYLISISMERRTTKRANTFLRWKGWIRQKSYPASHSDKRQEINQ
jgi:hypothetical protein